MRPSTRSLCFAQWTLIFRINCRISDHDGSICPANTSGHATDEVIQTRASEPAGDGFGLRGTVMPGVVVVVKVMKVVVGSG